jgi:preprotein translocase subunit YajC
MLIMHATFWNLAANAALFAADEPPKPAGGIEQLLPSLLPFVAIFVLFYFLLIRPQRRDQARRQEMLGGVKKNDRVVTVGGIYGVVSNVNREADEVTIKVDEGTNTKLRVTLSSIGRILGDAPSDENVKK